MSDMAAEKSEFALTTYKSTVTTEKTSNRFCTLASDGERRVYGAITRSGRPSSPKCTAR